MKWAKIRGDFFCKIFVFFSAHDKKYFPFGLFKPHRKKYHVLMFFLKKLLSLSLKQLNSKKQNAKSKIIESRNHGSDLPIV